MKSIITRINIGLLILLSVLLISGLILMVVGKEKISTDFLLGTAVISPIILATKGIEFMIDNQLRKAFLSILLLSVVCMISIIFVFIWKVQGASWQFNPTSQISFFASSWHRVAGIYFGQAFFETLNIKIYFYRSKVNVSWESFLFGRTGNIKITDQFIISKLSWGNFSLTFIAGYNLNRS